MTIIEQSAILPYTDHQLFSLINDIESYPSFMNGCVNAQVLERGPDQVSAKLTLAKAGLKYSFSTCNTLLPPHKIEMALIDGPFKVFTASWVFTALGDEACKVNLYMEFEFSSSLIDITMKSLFDASCKNLVNAVCKRAELLYGNDE